MLDDFVSESVSVETLDRWLKRKNSSRPAGMPARKHAQINMEQTHAHAQSHQQLFIYWIRQESNASPPTSKIKKINICNFLLKQYHKGSAAASVVCFHCAGEGKKKTIRQADPGQRVPLRVVFIIPALCRTNHSSSHMSALIVRVCDRQTKGRGNGPVGCLRVIWCVWAGRMESMPCTPHTADCFSDQPHPSRAHSAGTPPSQAADVRGDLQRHAAGCRGPKGGVGMVVVVAEAGWGGWSRVNGGENWQSADVSHFGAASYMRSAEFNAATQKWLLVPRAWASTLDCFLNTACMCACVCVACQGWPVQNRDPRANYFSSFFADAGEE